MNIDQYVFLIELLTTKTERSFVADIDRDPSQSNLDAYADFLIDHGRLRSADLVRNGFCPTGYVSIDQPTVRDAYEQYNSDR